MLWRHGRDHAEAKIAYHAARTTPCNWRYHEPFAGVAALLGTDQRYHLIVGGEAKCGWLLPAHPVTPDRPVTGYWHKERFSWWSDGTRSLLNSPQWPEWERWEPQRATVTWSFELLGRPREFDSVPKVERCPTQTAAILWPPFRDQKTRKGRIRRRLLDEFGPLCQGCGFVPGVYLDHDHRTGLIRGLLCRNCNGIVEHCTHLSGCPLAEYLNEPPAETLQLNYGRFKAKPYEQAQLTAPRRE